ncbi:MAG TPA: hypothetical protein VMK12_29165 [Anaeromyxobacteraceae bacterium]|nr:hypothetical protein [Anaeromyxobacteraceae bacterium]
MVSAQALERDRRALVDTAFTWLERVEAQADSGLGWLEGDPMLGGTRADPRYAAEAFGVVGPNPFPRTSTWR